MLPKSKTISIYETAKAQSHQLLRRNVLEVAGRLLVEKGPEALKVRTIADQLGCSTKIVYTMFGGKDGLANALYAEGMKLLREAIEKVSATDDPREYLSKVGWGYWDFAVNYPGYYTIMFTNALPEFEPDEANMELTEQAFNTLVGEVVRFIEAGLIQADDPEIAIQALWSMLHGVISLDQAHYFDKHPGSNVKIFEFSLQLVINQIVVKS